MARPLGRRHKTRRPQGRRSGRGPSFIGRVRGQLDLFSGGPRGCNDQKDPARTAAQESETAALTAAPAASGGYTIQLISLTSADAAESAWKNMREEHPDLLGQLSLTVEKANVSGNTYYRVQAGAFNDRSKARELCARLKAQKQDCLVVRR